MKVFSRFLYLMPSKDFKFAGSEAALPEATTITSATRAETVIFI